MLAGRPMLEWSIQALAAVAQIERIVVALPDGASAPAGTIGVAGGAVRSESVRAALAGAGPGDPVLVHDAARPLLSPALATRALAALEEEEERGGGRWDGAVCAAPMSDTVKQTGAPGDPGVHATLDRATLWRVQTPQVFRRPALERALGASAAELAAATDDAWLVERQGGRVRVVEAPASNLKVTTDVDLRLAELLLGERDRC